MDVWQVTGVQTNFRYKDSKDTFNESYQIPQYVVVVISALNLLLTKYSSHNSRILNQLE